MDNDGPSAQRRNTLVLHHWLSHWQARQPQADTAAALHPHHKHMRGMQLNADTVNNIIHNWRQRQLKIKMEEFKYLLNSNVDLIRELWTWSQPHYHGWDELIDEIIPAASRRHFERTPKLKQSDHGMRARTVQTMIAEALTWSTGRDASIVPTSGRRGPGLAPRDEFRPAAAASSSFQSPGHKSWVSKPGSFSPQTTAKPSSTCAPSPWPSAAPSASDAGAGLSSIEIVQLCGQLIDFGYKDSPSLTILDAAKRGGGLEAALDLFRAAEEQQQEPQPQPQQPQQPQEPQQPQPQPQPEIRGLYSPSRCGKQGREVPEVFAGLLDNHLQIGRQMRAAQDIVGRGAGGKEFKERRQRDLGRYGEQQQVQDVVAFYECISSEDELATEVTDAALMLELRKREALRAKKRLKENELKITKKRTKEDSKKKEKKQKQKQARDLEEDQQSEPERRQKKRKLLKKRIDSDSADESASDDGSVNGDDLRDPQDNAVDHELGPAPAEKYEVRKIKKHRWDKNRLELCIVWSGA